jgi:hypothetical protein
MEKQTIEDAANKYSPDPSYSDGQWEFGDVIDGFKAGAEWQKEQSANDAIELLNWLRDDETNYYLLTNWIQTKKSSKEVYELWLQTKNNS